LPSSIVPSETSSTDPALTDPPATVFAQTETLIPDNSIFTTTQNQHWYLDTVQLSMVRRPIAPQPQTNLAGKLTTNTCIGC